MKLADVEHLHAAGLISTEQRDLIIAHLRLRDEGGRFLAVISLLGALIGAAGVTLLVAANWDGIPRGVKLSVSLAGMWAAHATGAYLRSPRGRRPRTGAALHGLGSLWFLANIGLIGQVYHQSARLSDALWIWWLGIVALPWILNSTLQHVLALVGFAFAFASELWNTDGWLASQPPPHPLLMALLGVAYVGMGSSMSRWPRTRPFAVATERIGLILAHLLLWPLSWGGLYLDVGHPTSGSTGIAAGILGAVGLGFLAHGLAHRPDLHRGWRLAWGSAWTGLVVLMGIVILGHWGDTTHWTGPSRHHPVANGLLTLALMGFCILQVQVGLQSRSRFLVNLGLLFVGLNLLSTYVALVGTMAQTGWMLAGSGLFLVLLGAFLERQRRRLMPRLTDGPTPSPRS